MKTSIVIATYNGERYLKEQINSLLTQTVLPDEIIVCDDASTDKTVSIIEELLKDSNIYYHIIKHSHNYGVVTSFYDAIMNSQGEIIFLCDQDDVWLEGKIESFVRKFEEDKDLLLSFSDAYIVNSDLTRSGKTLWQTLCFHPIHIGSNIKCAYIDELLQRNIFTGMCMAFRSELIDKDTSFSPNMLHDEFLGWRALLKGKIASIDKPLVLYRQHSNNLVGSSRLRKFESVYQLKSCVKKSSEKAYKKYCEISSWTNDKYIYDLLKNACTFYQWRTSLFKSPKNIAFYQWKKYIVNGSYKRYTSKTEMAAIKDLSCIILNKHS